MAVTTPTQWLTVRPLTKRFGEYGCSALHAAAGWGHTTMVPWPGWQLVVCAIMIIIGRDGHQLHATTAAIATQGTYTAQCRLTGQCMAQWHVTIIGQLLLLVPHRWRPLYWQVDLIP